MTDNFYQTMYEKRKQREQRLSKKEKEIKRLKYNAYMKEYLKQYRLKNKGK